ncbi:hypothetical protein CPC08DRAFT_771291 [Agrocybe pediades]|nr:hypothetical protein CPC08DRAFT_771291 [Agrocybe pediades]
MHPTGRTTNFGPSHTSQPQGPSAPHSVNHHIPSSGSNAGPQRASVASEAGPTEGDAGPDSEDYIPAIRRLQDTNQQQREEINRLKVQNAANLAKKGTRRQQATTAEGDVEDDLELTKKLAKWFGLHMTILVDECDFDTPEPPFKWDSPARYETLDSEGNEDTAAAAAAELSASIPPPILSRIKESKVLQSEFRKSLLAGQSNLVHKIKAKAGDLFKIEQKVFSDPLVALDKCLNPDIQALTSLELNPNVKGGAVYTIHAPILYKDKDTTTRSKWFLNDTLIDIAVLTIYSDTQLGNRGKKTLKADPRSPYVRRDNWWTNKVTPGLISLVSVFTIYILSGDTTFSLIEGKGNNTDTDYEDFYRTCKQYLIHGHHTPHVKEVFRTWNAAIFPDYEMGDELNTPSTPAVNQRRTTQARLQDVRALLAELDLEDRHDVGASNAEVQEEDEDVDSEDGGWAARRDLAGLRPQSSYNHQTYEEEDDEEGDATEDAIELSNILNPMVTLNAGVPLTRTYSAHSFSTGTSAPVATSTPAAPARLLGKQLSAQQLADLTPESFYHNPQANRIQPPPRSSRTTTTVTQPEDITTMTIARTVPAIHIQTATSQLQSLPSHVQTPPYSESTTPDQDAHSRTRLSAGTRARGSRGKQSRGRARGVSTNAVLSDSASHAVPVQEPQDLGPARVRTRQSSRRGA